MWHNRRGISHFSAPSIPLDVVLQLLKVFAFSFSHFGQCPGFGRWWMVFFSSLTLTLLRAASDYNNFPLFSSFFRPLDTNVGACKITKYIRVFLIIIFHNKISKLWINFNLQTYFTTHVKFRLSSFLYIFYHSIWRERPRFLIFFLLLFFVFTVA